ncbi:hypothetical protein B0T18DRAFT_91502 [Schizothecium vesticola]|uniref:Uncharacterized protein n=1 Tax=Schizothecium vesticola TaxID=314040 RepID=A0AA40KAX5_9PEZI|nr:hypothetical protein B0T18DRAFT_91502 [Schizothecium vesticola]
MDQRRPEIRAQSGSKALDVVPSCRQCGPRLNNSPQSPTSMPNGPPPFRRQALADRENHTPVKSLKPRHLLSPASIERTDGIDGPHPSRSSYLHN